MVAESQVKLANGTVTVLSPPSIVCEDDLIQISVCGIIYDVLESTLQRYPNTLLGNPERRHQHFLKSRNLFYFDTNRQCFEAVLYYYQSRGTIIRPADIPLHTFEEDLAFFGLDEIDDGPPSTDKQPTTLKDHYFPWQKKLWDLFEFPDSGPTARVIALWSLFVIAISIVIFCMETMPEFKRRKTIVVRLNNSNMTKTVSVPTRNNAVWFSLELACIVWFTIEFVTRFVCSPNKLQFVKSILNLIDLIAILPYFITVCNPVGSKQHLSILRIVRLVRVFRIFKLSRYSNGLRILGETLQASISELAMLVFFLCLGVLLFSSAMYYAEEGESETFVSIPDAFWYSVVTMTTVGYGDKVPTTFVGKAIGTLCAISGVLTIALPVPVIVSNFDYFYKRDLQRKQAKEGKANLKISPAPYIEVQGAEEMNERSRSSSRISTRLECPKSPRLGGLSPSLSSLRR